MTTDSTASDPRTSDSLTVQIVKKVADHHGVEAIDLPPMQNVVDADSLEQIITSPGVNSITFEYAGLEINIDESDEMTMDPIPSAEFGNGGDMADV